MKNSWRLVVVGGLVALCSALSCSGERMASSDSVEAVRQELSANQTRILGFEGVAGSGGDWLATSVRLQSAAQHVEGSKAAAFAVTASTAKLTSVPLSSLGPISNQVTLSLWLPGYLAGLSYQGQVALHLNSPSAGVFSQYYGPVRLTNGSPTRTWQQLTFPLRVADVSALSSRTYNDLVVTIELTFNPNPAFNSNNPFADPGYVDALSFGAGVSGWGGAGGSSGASGSGGKSASSGASGTAGRAGGAGTNGNSSVGGTAGRAGSAGTAAGAGASGSLGAGTGGPCGFGAPPAATPSTPFTFTIQLPHGVARESVALSTSGGSLTIDDGVQVVKDGGGFASVSSVGATSRTMLGVLAQVQDVYSEPLGVDLRNNAHVHGLLKTAADLSTQDGARVDGVASQNTSLRPLDAISWIVPFPSLNRGSCSIEPDKVQSVDPGSYGEVAVKSRSHLKLRSGTYFFSSLSLEPQAILDVDNTAGPVFIYIKNNFAFSGSIVDVDRSHMNLLFGVASATQIAIQSAFRGILVAPQAGVVLPTDMATGHVGSFFAQSLVLHQSTLIHHEPLIPDEFCAADAACSSFCPCTDGRPCSADSQCRNGHSCSSGQCACVPNCSGKTCGLGNGCGGTCPSTCGNGDICTSNSECVSGSCTGQAGAGSGASVCEPADDHCSNQVRDRDESDVDCGGADCPRCPHGGGCTTAADCAPGDSCGTNNSACFGLARGRNVCWPEACGNASTGGTAYDCGSDDSACGKSCSCGACDSRDPTTVCPAGEVCKEGLGQLVGAHSADVCVDPHCPSNDPAYCGTPSSKCGPCVPTPDCSAATCQNPSDGAGGICPAVCHNGDTGCTDDIECGPGLSCIAGANGVSTCRPVSCAFQICNQASPECPDLCPVCTPSCDGRQCGPDPRCGQSCGECGADSFCDVAGKCVLPTTPPVLTVPDGNGGPKPLMPLPESATNPVGALAGQFSVSDQGSPVYNIPIEVPPGRAGMEPALSLQYSGSRANGEVGVGWHLEGLSKITRCPRSYALDGRTGPVQNDRSDLFCIDGKRLEKVAGTYGDDGAEYRTLIDSFAKVISHTDSGAGLQLGPLGKILTPVRRELQGPDSFVVWTKDGRKLTYGGTYDAMVLAHTGVRYAWLLNRVEDRAGNTMLVSYSNLAIAVPESQTVAPNSVVLPRGIAYTGHTGAQEIEGKREVYFDYEARTDPQLRFTQGGAPFIAAQRLSRITTFVDHKPVKNYHLQYVAGELSQVEKISECAGGDDSHCKAPTTFKYARPAGAFGFDNVGVKLAAAGQLDLNGDGLPDFMATNVLVGGVPAQPTLKAAAVVSDVAVSAAALALDAFVGPEAGFAVSLVWDVIKGPFFGLFAKEPTIEFQHSVYTATGKRGIDTFAFVPDVKGLRCSRDQSHPAFMLDYDQDGRDDVMTECNNQLYVARSLGNGNFESWPKDGSPVAAAGTGFDDSAAGTGFEGSEAKLAGPILIDVNGDGLQDIVSCPNPYTIQVRRRLTPPGAFEAEPISLSTDLVPPTEGDWFPPPRKRQILCGSVPPTYNSVDLDGDGTPDLLAYGEGGWRALRLSFSEQAPTLSWQAVAMPVTGQSDSGRNLNLGDFNGDGLPDVFGYDDKQYTVWLNTGAGRFYSRPIARPKPVLPQSDYQFSFRRIAVLDSNMRGRDEFLEHWETPTYDAVGNGSFVSDNFNWTLTPTGKLDAFATADVPSIEKLGLGGRKHPAGFTMTADVDGDGHVDLLGGDMAVFYSGGDLSLSRITDGLGKVVEIHYGSYLGEGGYKTDERCAAGNTPGNSWPEKCLPKMSGIVAGHSEGTLDASGALVTERVYTYTFVNGRMNLTGHGWLGFDRKIVTMAPTAINDAGTTTTIDYEPVVRYMPSGQVATDLTRPYLYPFAGLARTVTVDQHVATTGVTDFPPLQDGFNDRRIQTVNRWRVRQSAFNRPFPVVISRTTSTFDRPVPGGIGGPPPPFDFNGTQLSWCSHELNTDAYGNVYDDQATCYVDDFNVEESRTTKEFAPDPLSWLISNPDRIQLYESRRRDARREYSLNYSQGLLESVTRAPEDANDQWHRSTYVRDDFGNVKRIIEATKSAPARTTDITYDGDGIFPVTITNAAGQTTQISFNSSWGSPAQIVDPNGVAVQFAHDGFGRLTERHGPDGMTLSAYSAIAVPNPITAVGTISPKIQVEVQRLGAEGSRDGATLTEYDAYGRPVRTTSEGFAGTKVFQERVYDQLGRVSGITLPHTADLQVVPFDRYSYDDNLKRLTRIDHSDGSSKQYEYASWASLKDQYQQWFKDYPCFEEESSDCALEITRTIDEQSRENVVFADHNGRVIRNIDGDNTSNTVHTSNYVYGPFDQLLEAHDNRNLVTKFSYDDYGRLLTQTDPDTGDSTYTYNGFDELQTSKDPKQQLRTYNHDSLGRIESIVDPAGLTQWIYDQGPGALGRLSESISPASLENPSGQDIRYSYEPATSTRNRGFLRTVTYTIDGTPYPISLDYDDLGRTSRIHYPAIGTAQPIVAHYQYDPSGVLTGLDEIGSGTPRPIWRVNDVYQGHLLQNETLGNGPSSTRTTYGYNDARRWLENVQTTLGTEQIQSLAYTHYSNGLVHTLDTKGTAAREYQYDNLNRLAYEITSASPLPPQITKYTYDEIGNLLDRGTASNTYRPNQPHLLASAAGNAYSYDYNGNVQTRTGPDIPGETQNFHYTPFDLPRLIQTPNSNELFDTVQFEYSADEERVARTDSDGTTRHFIADLYQRKLDSAGTTLDERFRLYAGDRQIAEIVRKDGTEQTLYFHPDHLGSPETISDDNGAAYHQHFDPFGKPLDTPSPELSRVGFTGHDHDNDLGLIDMKGRVYDPLAGRFMTADPVMQAPLWSQGLNRYSYVFNNPINNTDPSGFSTEDYSGVAVTGWGGAVTGIAALQGFGISAVGAGAGGLGAGLNIATSIGTGQYSRFDGSSASTHAGVAPSAAPKGSGGGRDSAPGALANVTGNVGAARRPPSACDVGMCLAQATPAGEGAPGFEVRIDGTGGGVPVEQRSATLDKIISFIGREVAAAINIIVSLEEHRAAYAAQMAAANMVPAPKDLLAFPGARRVKPKTSVQGGGGLRKRWVDDTGGIYEWDSQHGTVERYDKRGKHIGEFDAKTGKQTKPADPTRRVEP